MEISIMILAGGKSSRFKSDKTKYEINGKNPVEIAVEKLKDLSDDIIILSNSDCKFSIEGCREFDDIEKNIGPMGAVYTGLLHAKNDYCFILACDKIAFEADYTATLISEIGNADAILPFACEKHQTLCSLVKKEPAIEVMKEIIGDDNHSMMHFYDMLNTKIIREKDDRIFTDINTEEDLFNFRRQNLCQSVGN